MAIAVLSRERDAVYGSDVEHDDGEGAMRLASLVTALLVLLSACATTSGSQTNAADGGQREAFDASAYLLGPGDRIRLIVYGEEDLSGEFAIDGAGLVSLPLIGEVQAGGVTVADWRRAVDARLREGYLRDPRVSAEVASYRPYFILGEVERPGTYAYQSGLTVLNAVATAEGFTYRANQKVIFIRRDGEAAETRFDLTSTTPVRPGDTIRVAERFF